MPFVVMEDLLDKLKLLDYEVEFVSELSCWKTMLRSKGASLVMKNLDKGDMLTCVSCALLGEGLGRQCRRTLWLDAVQRLT